MRLSQNSPNYRNTISAPALNRAKWWSRDVISTFSCCLLSAVSVLGNVTRHPLLFFMAKQHRSSFGLSRNILCQINSVVRQPSEINGELFSSAQLQKWAKKRQKNTSAHLARLCYSPHLCKWFIVWVNSVLISRNLLKRDDLIIIMLLWRQTSRNHVANVDYTLCIIQSGGSFSH